MNKALVLGHLMKTWGFYEIASYAVTDDADAHVTIITDCTKDSTARGVYGPPKRIIALESDPHGEYVHTIPVANVLAFMSEREFNEIEERIKTAYRAYLDSPKTEKDWDVFEVTLKLLL